MFRALLGLSMVWALTVACSDGDAEDFVFTPVAYSYEPLGGTPVPIAISPEGGRYVADEVTARVETDRLPGFTQWPESQGFSVVVAGSDTLGFTVLLVKVPPGSVLDAVKLIQKQPGIRAAGLNSIRRIQE